ncbi:type 2 isopentenyl-diphosphate Delta-isomerase [Methanobacterium alkalithermotolerans]|uniref:Isopentenyl-diphosphate delta-isomerase n=1 Tax=Methanobacterium alkalithermotolerans TaxID=2731220 RepID=A0A8T8K5S4_9EURY|nr:type 2 isopentenyl-diphosphate Delta-isomerase [Methanobacterium alkalithermotolerans]QUH23948.1 type 2 isopentenyl-diphosphate Delta-isomerase [Methanobacterium alkalithermotolerans]
MISNRKLEHLLLCAHCDVQYKNKTTGFEDVELIHRALGEVNKKEIDISAEILGKELQSPIILSAITGGHPAALAINRELARAAEKMGIGMGVGSQRAAVENPELSSTYTIAREEAPSALLIGNIGAPQIEYAPQAVEMIDADALAVHLNPLQESIQPEGDLDARGYAKSIGEIVKTVDVPVVVKETGTGISQEDALILEGKGIDAIDVAGSGGTSWAAVETYRADDSYLGELYWDWGIPTAISTVEVCQSVNIQVISSGGIRSGLDAAKAIALGADGVGIALPVLKEAYMGYKEVIKVIERFQESLKSAMFLVGASNLEELQNSSLVIRGKTREWLKERGFHTEDYARRL